MNPDDMNDDELQAALRAAAEEADVSAFAGDLMRAAADRIGDLASFVLELGEGDE